MDLSNVTLEVVQRQGHWTICPIGACPWAKLFSNRFLSWPPARGNLKKDRRSSPRLELLMQQGTQQCTMFCFSRRRSTGHLASFSTCTSAKLRELWIGSGLWWNRFSNRSSIELSGLVGYLCNTRVIGSFASSCAASWSFAHLGVPGHGQKNYLWNSWINFLRLNLCGIVETGDRWIPCTEGQ